LIRGNNNDHAKSSTLLHITVYHKSAEKEALFSGFTSLFRFHASFPVSGIPNALFL